MTPPTNPAEPDAPVEDPMATSGTGGATGVLLGRVLRTGVVVSASLIVLGLILMGVDGGYGGDHDDLTRRIDGSTDHPSSLGDVVEGVRHLRPDGVITLGLLVLVATPIVRVAVAGIDLRRRGDKAMATVAGLVLLLLAVSFVVDLVG